MSVVSPRPKVCHITSVHAPLDDRIFYRECVTLAGAGYDVVIVAPADKDQRTEGVQIRAVSKPRRRLVRIAKTTWELYRAAAVEDAEIYHLHDPELIPVGFLLRQRGKPVIYDAHEDLPDDVLTKQWIPRPFRRPLARIVEAILRLVGERFSAVVAATPTIGLRFPKTKTAIVSNYPRIDELAFSASSPFAEHQNAAIYIGSMTEIRGVWEMVEAFGHSMLPANSRLIIAGTFGRYADPTFERRVRSSAGWGRVDFLGWRPHAEVQRLLKAAKVGLVLLHPEPAFQQSLPTKLFEYMAAGLPVIASAFPLWSSIIEPIGCGILVDPLNSAAIAEAATLLFNNPTEAEAMGKRGQEAVFNCYNWNTQADVLLKVYDSLLHESPLGWAVGRG